MPTSLTNGKFLQSLECALGFMDDEAQLVVKELVNKLSPYQPFACKREPQPGDAAKVDAYTGSNGSVMFVHHLRYFPDFMQKSLKDVEKLQFSTHQQDQMYCRGTTGMLEILTNYRRIRTEKTIIAAVPSSRMKGGAKGQERAYIDEWHLKCIYDVNRRVDVAIVWDRGVVHFCFEHKAKLDTAA